MGSYTQSSQHARSCGRNTGGNPRERAPQWIRKSTSVAGKGAAIGANLCEEAGGARAERAQLRRSDTGRRLPRKLARNTELNYHHRQVAGLLWLLLRGGQTKAGGGAGRRGQRGEGRNSLHWHETFARFKAGFRSAA